ncbi:MAG: serpin family protein [Ruminococcus sp.]|nr:serpin family protein [Ruminococcus sp.]
MKKTIIKLLCIASVFSAFSLVSCGEVVSDTSQGGKPGVQADSSADDTSADDTSVGSTLADDTKSDVKDQPGKADDSSSAADMPEKTHGDPSIEECGEDFKKGYNDFAAELFRRTAASDAADGKNVLVSPESVIMALGMTANGANGETLSQMRNVLCKDVDGQSFNDNMLFLLDKSESSEDVTFSIANSLWARSSGFTLGQDFADMAAEYFGASVYSEPFDGTTVGKINDWVNEKTDGMIPSIINQLSPTDVTVLLNAIAFQGSWAKPYEDFNVDEKGVFNAYGGEKQDCAMLHSTEDVYISDSSAKGFLKYYKGFDYAFMAILPNEGVSVEDYISSMTGEGFSSLLNSAERGVNVIAQIPEFSYDYGAHLASPLNDMGMELPFTADADFTAMGETETGILCISDVIHKTHIELDRTGTKAAAATAVIMKDSAEAVTEVYEVKLDRPFVYAIVDVQNSIPVFIGAVNSVK